MPIVIYNNDNIPRQHPARDGRPPCAVDSLTSFSSLTFALRPSSASSFCPSRSSAYRWPCGAALYTLPPKGDERPEAGGVAPSSAERSRSDGEARILCAGG